MSIFENNRELLDSFRQGCSRALHTIYNTYVDDVARVVRKNLLRLKHQTRFEISEDLDELERDLVQEVFIRAFTARTRMLYDGLRPYRPFLMTIAHRVFLDHFRKRDSNLKLLHPSSEQEQLENLFGDDSTFQGEEDLDWKRQRTMALAYIEQLPADLKEFVELRFVEELSQYEIMDRLDLPRWRVRSIEKKLYKGLKKYLRSK